MIRLEATSVQIALSFLLCLSDIIVKLVDLLDLLLLLGVLFI